MLRQKISNFMYGRNGFDKFNVFLLVIYFAVGFVNTFLRNIYVYVFIWLLFFYIVFRVLSKNIYKRSAENRKYLSVSKSVSSFFKLIFMKVKFIKTYRFRRCKNCKAIMRLPIKKGKHTVRCVSCKKEFNVNIIV